MAEIIIEVICKHCGSDEVVKYGTYKGAQRYWCKVCENKYG